MSRIAVRIKSQTGKLALEGKHHQRAQQHQLVGKRIEDRAKLGADIEPSRDRAVERVGQRRQYKDIERRRETVLTEQDQEDRDHPDAAERDDVGELEQMS